MKLENAENAEILKGSANFESVLAGGHVIGEAKYAPTTPHHQRHDGGAWTYESTYDPAVEELLEKILDTDEPFRASDMVIRADADGIYLMLGGPVTRSIPLPASVDIAEIDNYSDQGEARVWYDCRLSRGYGDPSMREAIELEDVAELAAARDTELRRRYPPWPLRGPERKKR